MTSYTTDGTVGPWAKEKLDCLHKYLHAYTAILKEQKWCEKFIYIDAFAGAGQAPLRQYKNNTPPLLASVSQYVQDTEEAAVEYVSGSPHVALNLQFPFNEYIFSELNPERINKLKDLQQEMGATRNITILQGDANDQLKKIVNKYDWKKCRALAFLDPFGMQVPWSTIDALGKTGAIEIILNLPVGMAIQRLLPRSGKMSAEQHEALTAYFGSKEWENIVYEETVDLFGTKTEKRSDAGLQLAKWYQKRLQATFGFSTKPRLIVNTRGAHLYYLLWAGPKQTGRKIAAHVLGQGKVA